MGLTSHGQTKLNFQTAICSILHAQPYRGISICCSWKQAVSKCPSDFKRGADSQHTTSLKNIKKSWFLVLGIWIKDGHADGGIANICAYIPKYCQCAPMRIGKWPSLNLDFIIRSYFQCSRKPFLEKQRQVL